MAQALTQLRLAGVEGPYALVLDAEAYTAVAETRDHGYPILQQLNRLVPDGIVWGPALRGGYLLTTRGGDYELTIGQDVSIGYLRHTDSTVDLYLQETFTFAPYTSEASVYLSTVGLTRRPCTEGAPDVTPTVTADATISPREDVRLLVRGTHRPGTVRPAGSGTVDALDAGVHAQGKKLLEEAGEVWIAAEHEDDDSLALEISQLIYRAQVIMIGRGISLEQVYRHL